MNLMSLQVKSVMMDTLAKQCLNIESNHPISQGNQVAFPRSIRSTDCETWVMGVCLEVDRDTQEELILGVVEEVEPPYKIFVHNDDVTPYEFVIIVLQKFFDLTPLQAEHVTFVAHTAGVAYVATFPQSEAQKRVGKARFAASMEGYPLAFTIEPA